MEIKRLSARLTNQVDDRFGPEDQDWVQFLSDHKLYLREHSPYRAFTTLELVPYRYRPDEFYKKQRGSISQTWIFLAVNDLRSPTDFNESISHLWIVDPDLIRKLRRQYESSAQYQAKSAAR